MKRQEIKTVKKLMIDADETPRTLAQKCEVTPRFINHLLRGERRSNRCEAVIAKGLGIPQDRLVRLLRPKPEAPGPLLPPRPQ